MSEKLTITLTGQQPVRITKNDWPIIASASKYDNQYEFQANRKWKLFVRQHKEDGRCIVYGIYDTNWQNESDRRGGVLVRSIEQVPATIQRVADNLCLCEGMADDCIADLPAVEL